MAECYLGEIRMFAFGFAPFEGDNPQYMPCDGRILQISSYPALSVVIGNSYGGDGKSTFALPNLQGAVAIGSLGGDAFGQTQGSNTVTLTAAEMPLHSHDFVASLNAASAVNGSQAYLAHTAATSVASPFSIYAPVGSSADLLLAADGVSSVGGDVDHENRQPALAIAYMICVSGGFPPPSSRPGLAEEPPLARPDAS
jgi:microcystin-dependent protein